MNLQNRDIFGKSRRVLAIEGGFLLRRVEDSQKFRNSQNTTLERLKNRAVLQKESCGEESSQFKDLQVVATLNVSTRFSHVCVCVYVPHTSEFSESSRVLHESHHKRGSVQKKSTKNRDLLGEDSVNRRRF